jgi:hypothetical protein
MFRHSRVRTGAAPVRVGLKGPIAQLCAHRAIIHGTDLRPGLRTDGRFPHRKGVLTGSLAVSSDSLIRTCGAAVGVGFKGVVAQLGANGSIVPRAGLGPGLRASGEFFAIRNTTGKGESRKEG